MTAALVYPPEDQNNYKVYEIVRHISPRGRLRLKLMISQPKGIKATSLAMQNQGLFSFLPRPRSTALGEQVAPTLRPRLSGGRAGLTVLLVRKCTGAGECKGR